MMRIIAAILLVGLACGCLCANEQAKPMFVCPEGQIVANASECAPAATTLTIEPTTTTVEDTTTTFTTTTSSSSITSTTRMSTTTTTLCDDSFKGYLIIDDSIERCYRGYRIMLDSSGWNYTTKQIKIIVAAPGQLPNAIVARTMSDGTIGFYLDDLKVEIVTTRQETEGDKTRFIGLLKIT